MLHNYLHSVLGPALDLAAAAILPVGFRPAADDEAHRVTGDHKAGNPHCAPRSFTSAGLTLATCEFAEALSRYLEDFDRYSQVGRPGTESNCDALGGTAFVNREEIAPEHKVVDLRFCSARTSRCRQPHAADLLDQLGRHLFAHLAAGCDLLGGLGRGVLDRLAGKCGVSRNLGGRGGEVVHPDVIGTRDLSPRIFLTLGYLG